MMTLAQFEERLTALEKTVEKLQSQARTVSQEPPPAAVEGGQTLEEDDFIPGTECNLVLSVPPEETIHIWGRIVSIESGPPGLGLSDDEWASLGLEEDDE
jgi:hypothetical protein